MRATGDSPAMFLAPQPAEPDLDTEQEHDDDLTETPSEFEATLGLVSSTVIIPTDVTPASEAQRYASEGIVAAEAMQTGGHAPEAASAAPPFESLPRPSGFDITSFELVAPDQQVALPLEAALQQLTATIDQPTTAPDTAPTRVITAAHEVVEVVTRHVARGEHQITMVLKPAELGEVKVRVEQVHGDHVRVTLEAEKPEATQFLRERIPELQAALQQEGVTVRSIDVSLQASDGMSQRGTGDDAPARHQHGEREEAMPSDENPARPPKRTKRNPKDLDVLV